jgi:hypothetical protein
MNEPVKENPKTSKRSKRRAAMQPLGWDEIVSQPGMGGYLSFLNGPIPLPHLQGMASASVSNPGVVSSPEPAVITVVSLDSVSIENTTVISEPQGHIGPGLVLGPEPVASPAVSPPTMIAADPVVVSSPLPETIPEVYPAPSLARKPFAIASAPVVISIPAIPPGQRLRVRKCAATHDGHSLGEEVLYQSLWKAASPESAATRTIVIGWRGMSQLCRMTPKNCKINTQRLLRKLALEILSPYNTPESIGTTYRVFSDEAILQRRNDAGLQWVVRSRGVEFVDPTTGASLCLFVH